MADGAVVQLPEWTRSANEHVGHSLRPGGPLRISGILFRYPQAPDDEASLFGMRIFNCPEAVVEDCAFVVEPTSGGVEKVTFRYDGRSISFDGDGQAFIPRLIVRDSLFRNCMTVVSQYGRQERPVVSVTRCWFLGEDSNPLALTVSNLTETNVVENVFDIRKDGWIGLTGHRTLPATGGHLRFSRNTVMGGFINIDGAQLDEATLRWNHFCLATSNASTAGLIGKAPAHWQFADNRFSTLDNQLSENPIRPSPGGMDHPADFLSTDPLAKDYACIPENSPFGRVGRAGNEPGFAGTFPPGPASAEGDWFTRLRDRWKDEDE